ncbi:class I SAM-dependent methyltransferase [Flammeovirga agarivorans]|uniref:Class I SAM-dependent methyltransferase n=1 Tax=Flammeovirga agarivorans TaxID=2726742 RepID=A0A7X8XV86_9BACT|nr:class I SAM-dependent methyltransferase [Flammeovirga agarivorans]NLR90845.1 class I SAM-dependent methyltransferase [Flammeovirga agarivorans]
MKKDHFNPIAKVYDRLAKIVFGNSIIDIQHQTFEKVKMGGKVLILGGGSGKILPFIDQQIKPNDITYVELSSEMIELAKDKKVSCSINFIQDSYEVINPDKNKYDVLITNFFLDILTYEKLTAFINTSHELLNQNGQWIVTDFRIDPHPLKKVFHQTLHKCMVLFFKITVNLQNSKLYDYEEMIRNGNHFQQKIAYKAFSKMMFSTLFQKV